MILPAMILSPMVLSASFRYPARRRDSCKPRSNPQEPAPSQAKTRKPEPDDGSRRSCACSPSQARRPRQPSRGSIATRWYRIGLPTRRGFGTATNCRTALANSFSWTFEKGLRRPAFDHARVAEALSKSLGRPVTGDKLPIERLVFQEDASAVVLRGPDKAWRLDLGEYELRETTAEAAPAESLPAQRRPRPTSRTGPETSVTFVNNTPAEIVVYWLDMDGEKRRYAAIGPGHQHSQHTYAGHVWLVTDPAGATLGVFEAAEEDSQAVVEAGDVKTAKRESPPEHRGRPQRCIARRKMGRRRPRQQPPPAGHGLGRGVFAQPGRPGRRPLRSRRSVVVAGLAEARRPAHRTGPRASGECYRVVSARPIAAQTELV